jgi:hypothetical protein
MHPHAPMNPPMAEILNLLPLTLSSNPPTSLCTPHRTRPACSLCEGNQTYYTLERSHLPHPPFSSVSTTSSRPVVSGLRKYIGTPPSSPSCEDSLCYPLVILSWMPLTIFPHCPSTLLWYSLHRLLVHLVSDSSRTSSITHCTLAAYDFPSLALLSFDPSLPSYLLSPLSHYSLLFLCTLEFTSPLAGLDPVSSIRECLSSYHIVFPTSDSFRSLFLKPNGHFVLPDAHNQHLVQLRDIGPHLVIRLPPSRTKHLSVFSPLDPLATLHLFFIFILLSHLTNTDLWLCYTTLVPLRSRASPHCPSNFSLQCLPTLQHTRPSHPKWALLPSYIPMPPTSPLPFSNTISSHPASSLFKMSNSFADLAEYDEDAKDPPPIIPPHNQNKDDDAQDHSPSSPPPERDSSACKGGLFRSQSARTAPIHRSLESSRAPGSTATHPGLPRSFSETVQAQAKAIAADIIPSAASIPIDPSMISTIKITPLNPGDVPAIEHSDTTLLAIATAFASQKHFADIRSLMLPAYGLSFHLQKIKDYPESGFFFHCGFIPHSAALSALKDINWQAILSSCPSFNFSCPARDKKSRVFKPIHARLEILKPSIVNDLSHRASIQCFILFNPVLLHDPIAQICQVLQNINLANTPLTDHISIPPPLAGKHASAHTKQLTLRIPLSPNVNDSEQLLYNLTLAHFKGLSALQPSLSEQSNTASLSLRLPMVTDSLARKTLSPSLLDYFLQLLESEEFSKIERKRSKVDRRGIYHEGTSASSATGSESEHPPPPREHTASAPTPASIPPDHAAAAPASAPAAALATTLGSRTPPSDALSTSATAGANAASASEFTRAPFPHHLDSSFAPAGSPAAALAPALAPPPTTVPVLTSRQAAAAASKLKAGSSLSAPTKP